MLLSDPLPMTFALANKLLIAPACDAGG